MSQIKMLWHRLKLLFNFKPHKEPFSPSAGAPYERMAEQYLIERGLTLNDRNYRCKAGEIDLVMREQETLVFVEVRFRAQKSHGSAAQSVTLAKQRRLRITAKHYLLCHKHNEATTPCRFDVVAFDAQEINWIKNAF